MPRPDRSYFVCMVQRCGSNVLCEALARTGVAGRPTEYFMPTFPGAEELGHELAGFEWSAWARERGVTSLPAFLDAAVREGSTDNGVFGAKLPANALEFFLARLRELPGCAGLAGPALLAQVFGPSRFVRVRRRDRVGQAVSWAIASQTGHYSSEDARLRAPAREPRFDLDLLDGLMREIERGERLWDGFLSGRGGDVFWVDYEQIAADLEGVVRRVVDWLGVPCPELDLSGLRHARQATDRNADWATRYRAARGLEAGA